MAVSYSPVMNRVGQVISFIFGSRFRFLSVPRALNSLGPHMVL